MRPFPPPAQPPIWRRTSWSPSLLQRFVSPRSCKMASGDGAGATMVDSESLAVLHALRDAAPSLAEEWREGSDVMSWKRIKWDDASGEMSEL